MLTDVHSAEFSVLWLRKVCAHHSSSLSLEHKYYLSLTFHFSSLHSSSLISTTHTATDLSFLSFHDDSLRSQLTAVILINWHSCDNFFSYDITLTWSDNEKLSQCDHQLIILNQCIFTLTFYTLKFIFSLSFYVYFMILICFSLSCVTLQWAFWLAFLLF